MRHLILYFKDGSKYRICIDNLKGKGIKNLVRAAKDKYKENLFKYNIANYTETELFHIDRGLRPY